MQLFVAFITYYAFGAWGLSINPVNTFAAPLWPAAGLAIAALYFGGIRIAPAIFAAAFALNFNAGAPLIAAAGIGIGNTIEAIAALYLLRGFQFQPFFSRLMDSLSMIAVALSVPFIAAIIGPSALALTPVLDSSQILETSFAWWLGDVLGILVVAPFLIKWFSRPIQSLARTPLQWFEVVLYFMSLTAVTILIFWDPIPNITSIVARYQIFVPLTWGALRVGPRFMTASLVVVSAISLTGTLMGVGPFGTGDNLHQQILLLQLFIGTTATICLLFVAAVEERKLSTQSLERHVEDLEEDVQEISAADRAKNEFIAILSHELRNPLAPVLSSLELMRLNVAQMPQFKDTIESMSEQVHRMTRLLDDLLDITRISAKKFKLQVERVRFQDVLAHSISTSDETIRRRNHTLTSDMPHDSIWMDADPLRLEQVFVNLLNNAAKYTPPGGHIALRAVREENGVRITVTDNGLGIPPAMQQAIFEPFRQAHAGIQGGTGLGIGLSLSRRFVELHGGTISVSSDGEQQGSTFTVYLPIPTAVAVESPIAATSVNTITLKETPQSWDLAKKQRRSVLVIDDNEDAARSIAQLLNHSGHTAKVAFNGAMGLEILEHFQPDIILLDIGLPDEDGYAIAQKIRARGAPQPSIVALTGFGQDEDRQRTLAAGFDHHLTKPVSIADLEKILQKQNPIA